MSMVPLAVSWSPAWIAVIAAAVGALSGLLGGWWQRLWEQRTRHDDRIREVAVTLLAETIGTFRFQVYGDRAVRRTIWYHTLGVARALRLTDESMMRIATAKAELDQLVDREDVHEVTDKLLEAARAFTELSMRIKPAAPTAFDGPAEDLKQARLEFNRVVSPLLKKPSTWRGRRRTRWKKRILWWT